MEDKGKNTLQKILDIPVLGHILSFVILLALPAFGTLLAGYIINNETNNFFTIWFPRALVAWNLLLFRWKIKGAVFWIVIGLVRIVYLIIMN